MPKIKSNKFLQSVYDQVPRLLGQLNRNSSSKTYGSFDRAYWHYRTNDISCARYQEAVYTLALLYCSQFENNLYFENLQILEWIRASLRFTVNQQRNNGSFDEWYIHEGSYVATAFLTAAIAQTVLLFKERKIIIPEEQAVRRMLEAAAEFLSRAKETTVMNQVSGAIFAIAAVGKAYERDYLLYTAEDLLEDFLSKQNTEGWWMEYGGPDIGYLTLTISYLEKYQLITGSDKVADAIKKAKLFVNAFINPDMTAGGEYMSRNTEYIIPSLTLPYLGSVGPAELDDRYLCYILYNWLETGIKTGPTTPTFVLGQDFYQECGLLREANKNYFLVANGKKGGSFRIYAEDGVYYDSGAEVKYKENLSAGILDSENRIIFEEGKMSVSGFLKPIKEPIMNTAIAVPFKAWQMIFGRITFFQKILKDYLRPRMISYSKKSKIPFERTFEICPDSIIVTDKIHADVEPNAVLLGSKSSYSAVPSSKYVSSQLAHSRLSPTHERVQENGSVVFKRVFSFKK